MTSKPSNLSATALMGKLSKILLMGKLSKTCLTSTLLRPKAKKKDQASSIGVDNNWETPMHLSLFTTFCPPNILGCLCPPNIFDKSMPVVSSKHNLKNTKCNNGCECFLRNHICHLIWKRVWPHRINVHKATSYDILEKVRYRTSHQ